MAALSLTAANGLNPTPRPEHPLNFFAVCIVSIVAAVVAPVGAAAALGLIPGLMASDNALSAGYMGAGVFERPSEMNPESARLVSEFAAENLLRSREGGRLTADITAWSSTHSVFVPVRLGGGRTVVACSRGTSDASLFLDDAELGSDLSWEADTWRAAFCRTVGSARVGFGFSRGLALCEGRSLYPQNAFDVLEGWTNTVFTSTSRSRVLEIAHPLGSGILRAGVGKSGWDSSLRLDQGEVSILIPVKADMDRLSAGAECALGRGFSARVDYQRGEGHSNETIQLDGRRAGRLEVRPEYSRLSIAARYRRDDRSALELGFGSDRRSADVLAAALRGNDLGIDLGSFTERIDVRGNLELRSTCYHFGFTEKVSQCWELRAVGKAVRMRSPMAGDFIGRGLLGLVSVRGEYQWAPVADSFFGLAASARFTRGPVIAEFWIEQAIPRPRRGGHYSGPSEPKTRSVGGTSAGVSMSRVF